MTSRKSTPQHEDVPFYRVRYYAAGQRPDEVFEAPFTTEEAAIQYGKAKVEEGFNVRVLRYTRRPPHRTLLPL